MINIAELLKDCPTGMELDCSIYENVTLVQVKEGYDYPIVIETPNGQMLLSKYGCFSKNELAKCIIFPKGETTWEGFVPPCGFKDGDILCNSKTKQPFILKFFDLLNNNVHSYCGIDVSNKFYASSNNWAYASDVRLATEEKKEKLFKAIKDNGYKWNPETKTLEKLVKPKFKVGNKIEYINGKNKDGVKEGIILSITNDTYDVAVTNDMGIFVPIAEQDDWELVPNKFDISTLNPFNKVLVRCNSLEKWHIQFFEKYNTELDAKYPFICLCNSKYCQCIPYEGNEHLLGTTVDCDEYYKTWK